jgi:hypothetical protein
MESNCNSSSYVSPNSRFTLFIRFYTKYSHSNPFYLGVEGYGAWLSIYFKCTSTPLFTGGIFFIKI